MHLRRARYACDGTITDYYNYFRDYDPAIGRYIQSDPIGLDGGINTYAYVDSDPLNWSDPSGLVRDPTRRDILNRLLDSAGGGGAAPRFPCCQGLGNVGSRPKPVNLPSASKVKIDMKHVQDLHMVGGSRVMPNSTKTLFPENMTSRQVERAIKDAYRNCEKVKTQGDSVLVRGVSRNGLTIEMWVNIPTRTIQTAYPLH